MLSIPNQIIGCSFIRLPTAPKHNNHFLYFYFHNHTIDAYAYTHILSTTNLKKKFPYKSDVRQHIIFLFLLVFLVIIFLTHHNFINAFMLVEDLMATIEFKPGFMTPACYGPTKTPNPWIIKIKRSSSGIKKQVLSVHLQKNSPQITCQTHVQFDDDHSLVRNKKHESGQFVTREAVLDEEYWTAARLRAETHWENRTEDRFADSYKKKFTEQEFNALKRQSVGHKSKSACIVTVKKEHGSVVGTLDVSVRPFLHGETFPGEKVKAHSAEKKGAKSQYGYIANLCVAKCARRQGIARSMLHFAIDSAISDGTVQVYVHVHRNNIAAQELYQKLGFKVVDLASPQLSRDKMYLLCYTSSK